MLNCENEWLDKFVAMVWTRMNLLTVVVFLRLAIIHAAKKQDDVSATTGRPLPPPPCFRRFEYAGLVGFFPFRAKKNNDSPNKCAEYCTKIHDDQDELRTCRAFDYNTRSEVCRFYERNSQDDNVRIVDNNKLAVYELDEICWAKRNAPPTPPPHVSACKVGEKPLMERVGGFYLKTSGLAFKQIPEKECIGECLKDETPFRHENYKCSSVSYNEGNQVCVYLNQVARPLNKAGPPLTWDNRYNYYSKLCLTAEAAEKCPSFITRFVGKQLVAMADAKITTRTYSECVSACLTAQDKLGFSCLSGMFYNKQNKDNCILNYSDHYEEHTLFIDEKTQETDYFSLKSCHW